METSVGTKMRQARIDRKLTIKQVSFDTKTSASSISNWENSRTLPSKRSVSKLSDYYGVDLLSNADESTAAATTSKENPTTSETIVLEDALKGKQIIYQGKVLSDGQKVSLRTFLSTLLSVSAHDTNI